MGHLLSLFLFLFLFSYSFSPDNKNSDHCIAQLGQSGLGLPDRDYYFDEDKAEKRELYKKHVANMLQLLDPTIYTKETSASISDLIFAVELDIAGSHMTKTEKRDPLTTYNKMSLSDLNELCDGMFDFNTFFLSVSVSLCLN